MIRFWNLIYYFVSIGDYRLHSWFNRINPVLFLYKHSYFKRRFKKIGVDNPVEELNKSFRKFDSGISSFRAGELYILIIMVLVVLVSESIWQDIIHDILILMIVGV